MAIDLYVVTQNNADPQSFIFIAGASDMLAKVTRAQATALATAWR